MRRTQAEVSYLSTITIESEESLGKDGIGRRFLYKERDRKAVLMQAAVTTSITVDSSVWWWCS